MGEPTTVVFDSPAWVLLHVEAQARGFKNALAFRRWLRRHQVPVRRDGHRRWVRRTDVDHAIDGLTDGAESNGAAPDRAAVSAAVAVVTRRH